MKYWQLRGSLVHTDTKGNDLVQPDFSPRVYVFSSSQHFAPVAKERPQRGPCQLLPNIVPTSFFFRALLGALDKWASDETPPPPSQIPSGADGTLVSYSTWRTQFPGIPGYAVPVSANSLPHQDFGPDEDAGLLKNEPPQVLDKQGYAVLVPAVDQDGNDIAGLRAPMVEAPLATYTGWNLRQDGRGKGAMYQFTGGMIPFAGTMSERRMSGDPRPSIEERYADADAYRNTICVAARRLAEAGSLLEEDVDRICDEARDWDRPRHDVSI